jgi:hypothetical protein
MNNPVGWFEIDVQDMARAKVFYEAMSPKPPSGLMATWPW